MAKVGKRYTLVIYNFFLNRWWWAIMFMGLVMLLIWWAVSNGIAGRLDPGQSDVWLIAAIFVIGFSLFLFLIRKKAYVQPMPGHLRLVTPFLRMNIAYKRIRRTSTAEMQGLFPPNKLSGWNREIMRPFSRRTVVFIEMTAWPVSRLTLMFFLSPFFFPAKGPVLAFLVDDWMGLVTEIEGMRVGGGTEPTGRDGRRPGILSNMGRK